MFTQKQINAFIRSENMGFKGIGYNDNWNILHFGITSKEAGEIRKRISEVFGMRCFWPKKIKPSDLD